jgi:SAM-dependent methyltransferase
VNAHDVRRQWADRTGEFSPVYYAHRGPNETSEAIRTTIARHVPTDAPVLEVGCSAGRHLAHLHRHGFENLTGVDVNGEAFDVMAETYPALAEAGTFHVDAIEDVVGEFADDRFAATYSVETLQHVHPDADWVFAELARVTDDLLITVENEGSDGASDEEGAATASDSGAPEVTHVRDDLPLYHRNWRRVFTELGFVEVDVSVGDRDTMRTFRARRE